MTKRILLETCKKASIMQPSQTLLCRITFKVLIYLKRQSSANRPCIRTYACFRACLYKIKYIKICLSTLIIMALTVQSFTLGFF